MTTEPTAQELTRADVEQWLANWPHYKCNDAVVASIKAALLPTAPQPDAGWLESLKAIWVFAQDTIENGHCEGGALGNLYGIRDETDRLIARARGCQHDVGLLGRLRAEALGLTLKHGSPHGTDYEQGVNDQGKRWVDQLDAALKAEPLARPVPAPVGGDGARAKLLAIAQGYSDRAKDLRSDGNVCRDWPEVQKEAARLEELAATILEALAPPPAPESPEGWQPIEPHPFGRDVEEIAAREYRRGVSAGAAAHQLILSLRVTAMAPTLADMLEEMLTDANRASTDRARILNDFRDADRGAAAVSEHDSFLRCNRLDEAPAPPAATKDGRES